MNPNRALRNELLAVGLQRYDGRFYGGRKANNKLELSYDALSGHPELLGKVVTRMCELIEPYEPDFVVGIPEGATGYATRVALELDLYNPYLKKTKQGKQFDYMTGIDREIVDDLERGVLVEDVFTEGNSTQRALQVKGLGAKIVVVAAVFDRGKDSWRRHVSVDKPVVSVASRPIRPVLRRHSRLWRYAS